MNTCFSQFLNSFSTPSSLHIYIFATCIYFSFLGIVLVFWTTLRTNHIFYFITVFLRRVRNLLPHPILQDEENSTRPGHVQEQINWYAILRILLAIILNNRLVARQYAVLAMHWNQLVTDIRCDRTNLDQLFATANELLTTLYQIMGLTHTHEAWKRWKQTRWKKSSLNGSNRSRKEIKTRFDCLRICVCVVVVVGKRRRFQVSSFCTLVGGSYVIRSHLLIHVLYRDA